MFTGIVTDIGTIESVSPLKEGIKLRVATNYDPTTIDMGASISHSGICLTVTGLPQEGSNGRVMSCQRATGTTPSVWIGLQPESEPSISLRITVVEPDPEQSVGWHPICV